VVRRGMASSRTMWPIVPSGFAGRPRSAPWWVSGLGTIGSRKTYLIALVLCWGERCAMAPLVFVPDLQPGAGDLVNGVPWLPWYARAGFPGLLIREQSFADSPGSGDEWSYVLQAESFSQGRLHANSPAQPRCFDVLGVDLTAHAALCSPV
jgi:hypothetical protein